MKPQILRADVYGGVATVTVGWTDEKGYRHKTPFSIDLRQGLLVADAVARLRELADAIGGKFA